MAQRVQLQHVKSITNEERKYMQVITRQNKVAKITFISKVFSEEHKRGRRSERHPR